MNNNILLDKGIILSSGEISKDKINLVAGAITQPFAEMVWVTTGGDMETINRLTDILVSMKPSLWELTLPCWNTSFSPLRQILGRSSKTISQK